MTFQPPPPPPPPPGYPPPGGQQPRPGFDPKTVNPLDWAILAVGLLAFIFSFISYYVGRLSTSGSCFGFSGGSTGSESAWHGFFGWFAVLCAPLAADCAAEAALEAELAESRAAAASEDTFETCAFSSSICAWIGLRSVHADIRPRHRSAVEAFSINALFIGNSPFR